MQLRQRQVQFRDKCAAALTERGNTLGVAPTGAGKTVMLSAVCGVMAPRKMMVLQHREELVAQNKKTFEIINPKLSTGIFNAKFKETWPNAIFAMAQTLVQNLENIPSLDLLAIDEAHHAAAPSYAQIIDAAKIANPEIRIFGVTATPGRGDKKPLRGVFDNCADQISLKELIDSGYLVKPRAAVVDIGVQEELQQVKRTALDFDMTEVAAIMDRQVLNDKIFEEWKERAGDRQTVIFCSTVAHANHVCETFVKNGIKAEVVDGKMATGKRADLIQRFDKSEFQVIVNVAVLTEGWDCQPVSCVVLLRPSSFKSTMIQMIGRGLRKLDPERYPGRHKDDCVVLDFGTSLLIHGDINQHVDLERGELIDCQGCGANVPATSIECPICGEVLREPEERAAGEGGDKDAPLVLDRFKMTEIDILGDSPLRWVNIFEGRVMIATAFEAWGVVINYHGRWHSIGGANDIGVKHLCDAPEDQKTLALASADDFLRLYGDTDAGNKKKAWMREPASEAQMKRLGVNPMQAFGLTKYDAACYLTWQNVEAVIRRKLEDSQKGVIAF